MTFILFIVICGVVFYVWYKNEEKKKFFENVKPFLEEKGIEIEQDPNNLSKYIITEKGYKELDKLYHVKSKKSYSIDNLLEDLKAMKVDHNLYNSLIDDIEKQIVLIFIKDHGITATFDKTYYNDDHTQSFKGIGIVGLGADVDSLSKETYKLNCDDIIKIIKDGNESQRLKNNKYWNEYLIDDFYRLIKIKQKIEFQKRHEKLIKNGEKYGNLVFGIDEKYDEFVVLDIKEYDYVEAVEVKKIDKVYISVITEKLPTYKMNLLKEPDRPSTYAVDLQSDDNPFKDINQHNYEIRLAEYQAQLLYVKQHNDEERRKYEESLNKTEEKEVVILKIGLYEKEFPIGTKKIFKKLLPDKVDF